MSDMLPNDVFVATKATKCMRRPQFRYLTSKLMCYIICLRELLWAAIAERLTGADIGEAISAGTAMIAASKGDDASGYIITCFMRQFLRPMTGWRYSPK